MRYLLLYLLSLCYHRPVSGAMRLQPLCCAQLCVLLILLIDLWSVDLCTISVWVCTLHRECLFRQKAHFKQSCNSTSFCKAEKKPAASKRQSLHDDVRKPIVKVSTPIGIHISPFDLVFPFEVVDWRISDHEACPLLRLSLHTFMHPSWLQRALQNLSSLILVRGFHYDWIFQLILCINGLVLRHDRLRQIGQKRYNLTVAMYGLLEVICKD